jgi:hypothetical protein
MDFILLRSEASEQPGAVQPRVHPISLSQLRTRSACRLS